MIDIVTMRQVGAVAVIEIQNPPVNALNVEVRRGLLAQLTKADLDSEIKAIVIAGGGRTFSAGADITEFEKPMLEPILPDVINRIEDSVTPVICVIHGRALGGGAEIALGCHYRLMHESAQIGFPEINIGVFPGAGGTQRMPRLSGMDAAYGAMLSGTPISAKDAIAMDLIDVVVEGDLGQAALDFANKVIRDALGPRPTKNIRFGISNDHLNQGAFEAAEKIITKAPVPLLAHEAILKCVAASAVVTSIEEGQVLEREYFMKCLASAEHQGLKHAFLAERLAVKIPEAGQAKPRNFKQIGIIGGGTMGSGIACAVLDAGLPVVMVERDEEALAKGKENVEKIYSRYVEKGRMTVEHKQAVMALYTASTNMQDLADADVVIEAVFEQMEVKKDIFTKLAKIAKPGAVLASNTSYLDIDAIASVTSRPQDVIGLHFFSPANVMKLLEIVIPSAAADTTIATGVHMAKKLNKLPVRASNSDGFIGNRILDAYASCGQHMVEDGASPYDIDRILVEFGYPMGLFSMLDLAGGDIGWERRKSRAATRDAEERYVEIADRLCERGWFGQKTGRGWYRYQDGERRGTPDSEIIDIINAERIKKGTNPVGYSDNEILLRYMSAMINEGANCVYEGVALRPSDVDLIKLYGYGFPRWRGGPMRYADAFGLDKILHAIKTFATEDSHFWKPSPLLEKLVADGKNFSSLNK